MQTKLLSNMKAKTNKHEEYIKAHAAAIPQLEAAIQQLKVARLDVSTESIADIVLSDSKAIRTQAKRLAAEDAKQIKIVRHGRSSRREQVST